MDVVAVWLEEVVDCLVVAAVVGSLDAPLCVGEGVGAAMTVVSDLEHSSGLDTETFLSLLEGPGDPGSSTDELISRKDMLSNYSGFEV